MRKIFIAVVSISFLVVGCKTENGSSNNNTTVEANNSEEKTTSSNTDDGSGDAICLLDKLSVRETPTAKGKWITSMSLGEKVYFTGEKHIDSVTKKDYFKVKLIDGKEGWSRAPFLAVNGKVGVMLKKTNTYKRPDLLTKTGEEFSPMDIIAVVGEQDDWVQVKGKRATGKYIEEVWIKSNNISNNSIDIATAKYAGIAMAKPTMTDRIKALQEVVGNSDLSESTFISLIKDKIRDYESKNVPVDVQDVKVDE
ncbi:SH3 domain-containing protein [Tenacibaculum jejuense]|uniref:Putative SH3 type 3 domain protein n=1 Tax=Tenacibaculum jejuense TaxID=584609 RepID=A0A238U988_9FLAO|nr:SH3 domain-containing protein [Tenacibaculum jejuense]SNR14980.1 putative SH3 type 3 domain protein [Tenacibaculum jejuense]